MAVAFCSSLGAVQVFVLAGELVGDFGGVPEIAARTLDLVSWWTSLNAVVLGGIKVHKDVVEVISLKCLLSSVNNPEKDVLCCSVVVRI